MAGSRIKGITVEIGSDTTKLQTALKGVNSEIKNTQNQLKDVEKFLKLGPGNTEPAGESLKSAGDKVSSAGEKFLPASAAVTVLGVAAVKTASDFDSSMSQVAAVSGATGEDFDKGSTQRLVRWVRRPSSLHPRLRMP